MPNTHWHDKDRGLSQWGPRSGYSLLESWGLGALFIISSRMKCNHVGVTE